MLNYLRTRSLTEMMLLLLTSILVIGLSISALVFLATGSTTGLVLCLGALIPRVIAYCLIGNGIPAGTTLRDA